jgi:hypothetical protein
VKIDLNNDYIAMPANFIKVITDNNGGKTDNTINSFDKLPTLKITLDTKEVLVINNVVYTSTDQKQLLTATSDAKSEYQISLGNAFLRHFCTILYQDTNTNQIAFTMPDPPATTKFATVSGVSFMALALIPLVNLFRF